MRQELMVADLRSFGMLGQEPEPPYHPLPGDNLDTALVLVVAAFKANDEDGLVLALRHLVEEEQKPDFNTYNFDRSNRPEILPLIREISRSFRMRSDDLVMHLRNLVPVLDALERFEHECA